MNLISAILLAAAIAAPAGAADFTDLQSFRASAISKVNPFPNPSGPDSCYLQGLKDGLCSFKCRSGETFQVKPVNPSAASVYEKCGGGDYRDADKQQMPDAGSIWNQINNQHNPFPQPQPTTLDYCIFTEFKNNKCLFKCESGAILTEPAQKPDFSTGEPAGACATHIIRPVKPAFTPKAAATEHAYDSYGRYPTEQKAAEVMTWAANGLKFAKAEVTSKTVTAAGPGSFGFRLSFRSASPLLIESSPLFKVELDAYERMFEMADRLEDGGASVATHEVVTHGDGFYYVIGFFDPR